MKRILLLIGGVILTLFLLSLLAVHTWIGRKVKENIHLAQQQYGGTAEDALIAFLLDETHSPMQRTHTAIWTLGQIQSKKALPLLRDLYTDDPKGVSCFSHHDSLLCQYEIYKAKTSIEKGWWIAHQRLNK